MDDATRFDERALASIRRLGGDALAGKMISLFSGYAHERLATAAAAHSARDAEAVGRALHSLRAGAAQLGAVAVSEQCLRGEQLANAGDLDGLHVPIAALAVELPVALEWLGEAVRSGSR